MAHKTGAIGPKDLEQVVVDTTVQPKAVAHPTDARLLHRAIIKLVGLAKRNRVPLRLRTRLGRIIRHIRRKIDGDTVLEARFGRCSV